MIPSRIDFLVRVIDNYGDTGFALDLADSILAQSPETLIRFYSDDRSLFDRLLKGRMIQGIEYIPLENFGQTPVSEDILVFFDAKIDTELLQQYSGKKHIRVLSYLRLDASSLGKAGVGSLEGTSYSFDGITITHHVPSPLPEGAGIVRNIRSEKRTASICSENLTIKRQEWIESLSISGLDISAPWISVFCYPETFPSILAVAEQFPNWQFLLMGTEISSPLKNIVFIPFLRFDEYAFALALCDKNIVRGENSAMKAFLANKPFLWDFYKESNGAHEEKIEDFLEFHSSSSREQLRDFNSQDISKRVQALAEFIQDSGLENHDLPVIKDITETIFGKESPSNV